VILADTRHRLTRDDAQLAARLVARESGQDLTTIEGRLSDEGIDAILDDPALPGALLRHPQGAHASFALFAYVMVRHALRQAGESDRGLADYVSAILLHFGLRDRAYFPARGDGGPRANRRRPAREVFPDGDLRQGHRGAKLSGAKSRHSAAAIASADSTLANAPFSAAR